MAIPSSAAKAEFSREAMANFGVWKAVFNPMGDGNSKTAVVVTGTSRCVVGPYGKLKIAPLPIQASRRSNGPWQHHMLCRVGSCIGRPRARASGLVFLQFPGHPLNLAGVQTD